MTEQVALSATGQPEQGTGGEKRSGGRRGREEEEAAAGGHVSVADQLKTGRVCVHPHPSQIGEEAGRDHGDRSYAHSH